MGKQNMSAATIPSFLRTRESGSASLLPLTSSSFARAVALHVHVLVMVALGLLLLCAAFTSAWATTPPSMPASLPLRRDAAGSAFPSVAGIIILSLIFVAAFIYVQILRRKGTTPEVSVTKLLRLICSRTASVSAAQAGVRLLSTVRLSPRVSLHVVQWENRSRLLACTDSGVTVLGESDVPFDAQAAARPDVQSVASTSAPHTEAGQ